MAEREIVTEFAKLKEHMEAIIIDLKDADGASKKAVCTRYGDIAEGVERMREEMYSLNNTNVMTPLKKRRELTKDAKANMTVFLDSIDLKDFNNGYRTIQTYYLLGIIAEGSVIDEDELQTIKQFEYVYNFIDVLETECLPVKGNNNVDGFTENALDALDLFIDCILHLGGFLKNLRKIQTYFIIGWVKHCEQLDDPQIPLITMLDYLSELVEALVSEYAQD